MRQAYSATRSRSQRDEEPFVDLIRAHRYGVRVIANGSTSSIRGSMRSHILVEPGVVELREVPVPEPGKDEIVVRVRAALTCGTDVKAFLRGHPKFPMPGPFGHEFSGEIALLGSDVRGLHAGDAIMATPTAPCGNCYYCSRQQENLCDSIMDTMTLGAYAEYIRLPARVIRTNLFPKPAEMPFSTAALLEPLSCVAHGFEMIRVRPDDVVVLIGAGAISLLHLLTLRSLGVENRIVVGRSPKRAQMARQLGASQVLTGDLEESRQRVLDLTAGRGADVVIECTGQVEVWEAAPAFARRGGTVVFFGGCKPGTQVRLDTQRLHYDQLDIVSPFHFTPSAVRRARQLLMSPGFEGAALISGQYPLASLSDALAAHQHGDGIKFAVIP